MKTNYIFKARWLQGAASANESKKMQVNPRITLIRFACALMLILTFGVGSVWGYTGTFTNYTNSTLIDGYYIICPSTSASNKNYCAGTDVSSSRITGKSLTSKTNPADAYVWIIENTASGWTFNSVGSSTKYIRQKGTSSGGGMEVNTTIGYFTLAGYNSSSPVGYKFTSADQNSNNQLKWNNSSKWFANYANAYSTSMTPVCLYRDNTKYRAKTTQPATGSFTASATSATWDGTKKHLSWMSSGATVTLTATPPSGKVVNAWTVTKATGGTVTVTSTGTNTATFTMPADQVTVTVTWKDATYNLYLVNSCVAPALGSYSSNKGTSGSGTGVYAGCTKYSGISAGTSVTITASPTSGYVFDGWTDGGYSIILDDESNEITPTSTTSTTATITMPSSDVVIWTCNFSAEPECTAPHHVDVGSQWDWFKGETLTLSATAYSTSGSGSPITSGITAYQWYKGGTADGNKIAGATSATYTKSNCTLDDAGDYYCKVSTGSSCHTMSSAFGVKIYALEGYTGNTTQYNFTRIGSTKTGSVQIDLAANSSYQFKVRQGGSYYGNNGTIVEDENTWEFNTSNANNVTVTTYTAGKFTFTLDYSSNATSPKLAVTYPMRTLYLQLCSDWKAASAKYAIYYWRTATGWSEDFMTATTCDADILYASIPSWAQYVIFGRFDPSKGSTGNWDSKWNQTSNQTLAYNKDYLYSVSGSSDSYTGTWGTYSPATFTITFAGNGNTSGSMTNVTGIPCGEDRTLAANGYVKTGYNFNKWKTNVAITVGGAAVAANGLVANQATINNIASNITLTAQWTAKTTTVSFNQNGGSGGQTSSLTATYGSAMPTPITKPTKDHYTFEGYYDGSGGTGTKYYNADGTSARNWDKEGSTATLYAKWTAVNYTVTWYAGGTGSGNITTAGSPSTSVAYNSKVATLPSTPNGAACDKTFVGWTNTTSYTYGTSLLFTDAAGSPAITAATNFYAVFATGSTPETKNLTNAEIQTFHSADATNHGNYAKGPFTITSTDGNWYGVFASQNNSSVYTANIKSDNVTINSVATRPYLQSPSYSKDITSVSITHNCTVNRTLLICSSATATPDDDKIASISITPSNQSGVSANIPSGVRQLYLYSSSGGIVLKSIAVTIGGYSGHTLTCEDCGTSITPTFTASPTGGTVAVSIGGVGVSSGSTVKTCSSVALAVTITPDHHSITNFTATGLTTGTATISPTVASTLPKSVAQTFTVTVSAGATGTLNLTPTLVEDAYRTVVFKSNNEALFDDGGDAATFDATNKWKQKVYVGEKPVLPTALVAGQACDGSSTTFMGWVRDNQRWPGKSASGMPAGKTLITAASGFDAAAAGSGEIAYHAVWAQSNMESDVINRSATSSKLSGTGTSTWVTAWDLTGSTGAKYTIYSMGTSGGTQALQWNSNGYLYCKTAPTSGKKLFSIAVTGTDSKNVGLYGNGSAYSANSGGTSLGTLATGSTYTFTDEYGYIRITGTASSTQIETLTITYGSYTNYMTTCCTSTGLTLTGPTGDLVFITSSAEKEVRSQEAFHISGCGVSGSTTVSFDFGSSALNAKFTCGTETGGTLSTTCDGRIDTDFYIFYTPDAGDTSDGIDKSTSLTASVGGTLSASSDPLTTKAIIGRHLPANFVIAGKKNNKWYALPATMSTGSTPDPVEIAVDDIDDPTIAYTAASNIYGLEGPTSSNISGGNGQYIRLTMSPLTDGTGASGPAPLFASTTANVGKNGVASASSDLSAGWWWTLTQTNSSITNANDAKYNIKSPNNSNTLSIKNSPFVWGLYASGVDELRLIPAQTATSAEAYFIEWGANGGVIEVDAETISATKVKATFKGSTSTKSLSQTLTSGGKASKYNYTVAFDGIDFSAADAVNNILLLEWYKANDDLAGVTNIIVPKIIATSATMKSINSGDTEWSQWEVHVLPDVTLTANAGDFSSNDVTIKHLEIYPGATVTVTKGAASSGTLTATTLVLRNGWSRVGAKTYDVARLFVTASTATLKATNVYADWYIDYDQYYPVAVPWNAVVANFTYRYCTVSPSVGYNQNIRLRYYDGASRATNVQEGVGSGANWKAYGESGNLSVPATLTPSSGYVMTAKRPTGKAFSIIRMPLTLPSGTWGEGSWTTNGEAGNVSTTHKDQIAVTAHGVVEDSKTAYAEGWNLIANPYMALHQGALTYNDESGDEIEYANVPDINFTEYDQLPIATTKLKPSSAFLVQAPKNGTVTFGTANRKASAPSSYRNEAPKASKQKAYILLNGNEAEDQMGIIIGEQYTAAYELNADLEKLLSDGTSLRTYMRYGDRNMAYVAINEMLAKEWIPVTVRIPAEGEYTFSMHEASIADELEGIYLTDYLTGATTNLLYDSYTFTAEAGTISDRFAINAIIGEHKTPTGIDAASAGADIHSDKPFKFVYRDKVYILHRGVIYDATGKLVSVINK